MRYQREVIAEYITQLIYNAMRPIPNKYIHHITTLKNILSTSRRSIWCL